jgi:Secretion system C-terminal sorting domain
VKLFAISLLVCCIFYARQATCQWKPYCTFNGGVDFITADSGISAWAKFISVSGGNIYYANATTNGGKTWDTIFPRGPDEGISAEGVFACRKQHALYFDENYQGLLTMFRSTDCKSYKVLPFQSACDFAHVNAFCAPDTAVNYLLVDPYLQKYVRGVADPCFYKFSDSISPTAMFFADTSTGYLAADSGIAQLILKTIDGGHTWQLIRRDTTIHISSLFCASDSVVYAVGANGRIIKTVNGGISWQNINWSGLNQLNGVFFLDNSTGFITASNGIIIETTNGGASWIQQTTGTTDIFTKIFFVNDSIGFAATKGAVLYTINLKEVTGMNENLNSESKVEILPNPVNNFLKIKCNEPIQSCSMSDISGKIVLQQLNNEKSQQMIVSLCSVPNGVYFLSVRINDRVVVRKIVKQ